MKIFIALAAMLALSACSPTAKKPIETITIYVPVSKPCIEKAPPKPLFRSGRGEWPGDKAAAAILADDFEKAEQYGVQWETATIGCVETTNTH